MAHPPPTAAVGWVAPQARTELNGLRYRFGIGHLLTQAPNTAPHAPYPTHPLRANARRWYISRTRIYHHRISGARGVPLPGLRYRFGIGHGCPRCNRLLAPQRAIIPWLADAQGIRRAPKAFCGVAAEWSARATRSSPTLLAIGKQGCAQNEKKNSSRVVRPCLQAITNEQGAFSLYLARVPVVQKMFAQLRGDAFIQLFVYLG